MQIERFQMISPIRGTGNIKKPSGKRYHGVKEVTQEDIFDRLLKVGIAGQRLFCRLKDTYNYEYNTCHIERTSEERDLKKAPYKSLREKIKLLEDAELIAKLPKKYNREMKVDDTHDYQFLFNPYFLRPHKYELVSQIWYEIQRERQKKKPRCPSLRKLIKEPKSPRLKK
ncbi:hypothetical protein [Alteromonas sp. CYL-A6]|uniref:hypothetical protein n=1 Tax=Alteromonas nitratireducens TaxID=3390813 RepID=UPI0034C1EAAA